MKVVIDGYGEYEVLSISYGTDKFGVPVDISIIATKEVVEELIAYNLIWNHHEDNIEAPDGKLYWETLSGRWPPFKVLDAQCCRHYSWECERPLFNHATRQSLY